MSDTVVASITLADAMIGFRSHICAFFHNPDEEYRFLLPFINDGFKRGERAFHIMIIVGGIIQENSFFVPPISSSRNYVNAVLTTYAHLRIDLRITNAELAPRDQATPELYQ